ncbi:1307_t:CDS:2 [Entrophospora sp. SA101]|nr:13493_t:CDS:2 [Entrophospora sp. SA101]CAJ0760617.1 1307_t:CDS:2 [Entrophospora sp. SA101]CAJ0907926.1 7092_t:CDS:2 [Entrophospora sp. SA101]
MTQQSEQYEVSEEEWSVYNIIQGRGTGFIDDIKISELVNKSLLGVSWGNLKEILNNLYAFGLLRKKQTNDDRCLYQARPKEIYSKLQFLDNQGYEIFELIENSERRGIAKSEIQKQTKIVSSIIDDSLKMMQEQKLVKEVKPKSKKLYMLYDIKPVDESLSRLLYTNGEADTVVVEALKTLCYNLVHHRSFPKSSNDEGIFIPGYTGYPTLEKILQCVQDAKITDIEVEESDIRQILDLLVYEGKIVKRTVPIISSMVSEIQSTQIVFVAKKSRSLENAWTQIPCGRCPNECSEDGEISPSNCIFYQQWLAKGLNTINDKNKRKDEDW